MKSYTDLKQSKKLAEILSVESADMVLLYEKPYETNDSKFDGLYQALCVPFSQYDKSWRKKYRNISYFPCWSLTALLDLCPTINGKQPILTRGKLTSLWYCYYEDEIDTQTYDNPIDACYEMITRLNELNLL